MRERRYVKFRVDIYDDTKTKIIDQRPERDFIHYFFARSIVLAGKADCEGYLYMSKNIPYTIETLAIELNRDVNQVRLALEVLTELEMIEVTDGNIYRVKNFVKHQNIKVKEEVKIKNKEEGGISNKEVQVENYKKIADHNKNEVPEENEGRNLEIIHTDINNIDSNLSKKNTKVNFRQDNLVVLKMKDNKESNTKKKSNKNDNIEFDTKFDNEMDVEEIKDDNHLFIFSEGDPPPLMEGERIISDFSW